MPERRSSARWAAIFAWAALVAGACDEPPPAPEPEPAPPPRTNGFYEAELLLPPDDAVEWATPPEGGTPTAGGDSYVGLGEPLGEPLEGFFSSRAADNDWFVLYVRFRDTERGAIALLLDGRAGAGQTAGRREGGTRWFALQSLPREWVLAAAELTGFELREQHEIGQALQISVTLPRTVYAPGDPVVAQLEILNPEGAPPIQHVAIIPSARIRPPQVVVLRDGERLTRPEYGYGGSHAIRPTWHWAELAPGEAASRPLPITGLDLSVPGHYEARFETPVRLAPAGIDSDAMEHRHESWTRFVEETVRFEVR